MEVGSLTPQKGSPPRKVSPLARYKRAFITGLATLLPTILTIGLLLFAWGLLNNYIKKPVNWGVKKVLSSAPAREYLVYPLYSLEAVEDPRGEEPARVRSVAAETPFEEAEIFGVWLDEQYPGAIGLVLGITIIFFTGFFFTSFLGRKLRRWLEREFYRLPVIKAIYPYAKQVTEFIFKEKEKDKFTQVVAIEYPRKGIYSMGFVTGGGFQTISKASGRKMINLFIPSSPTPITGYTVFVPEDDVIPLPISVDEAIRFAVSGGVLIPASQAREGTATRFRTEEVAGISGRVEKE